MQSESSSMQQVNRAICKAMGATEWKRHCAPADYFDTAIREFD